MYIWLRRLLWNSFVTAVACLCASSYGPNVSAPANIKENIASALSGWDRNVLQIFVNSNNKFSFDHHTGDCELLDSNALDTRLLDSEFETEKQGQQTQKLMMELKSLRSHCLEPRKNDLTVTADRTQIKQPNSLSDSLKELKTEVIAKGKKIPNLKLQHKNDAKELEVLTENLLFVETNNF